MVNANDHAMERIGNPSTGHDYNLTDARNDGKLERPSLSVREDYVANYRDAGHGGSALRP
jgi:hypothetical protein